MKRFTERDEFGNADIIGIDSAELQGSLSFEEFNLVTRALNHLAELEDKLESGLVELPCKSGDEIWYIEVKGTKSVIIQSWVEEIIIRNDHIVVCIGKSMRKLIFDYKGKLLQNDWEIYLDKSQAEARLKELQEQKNG